MYQASDDIAAVAVVESDDAISATVGVKIDAVLALTESNDSALRPDRKPET